MMVGLKTGAMKQISSFPLAVSLYKGSSGEVKASKNKKKVKKSVLTLPTNNAPTPQLCTVSDINDSEHYLRDCDNLKKNKRRNTTTTRKCRGRIKGIEIYDRDAQYCSQMDIDLDCSSADMMKNYDGDTRLGSKKAHDVNSEEKLDPHDVWAVLRNINRFQFNKSPPISEESYTRMKKKKHPKRRYDRRGNMRMIETCHTEEFAYISSYEVESKSPPFSQASSFDRVTVIDKKAVKMGKEYGERTMNLVKNCSNKNAKPLDFSKGQNNDVLCLPVMSKNIRNNINQKNKCSNLCTDDSSLVSYKNKNFKDNNNKCIKKCDSKGTITQGNKNNKNINNHDAKLKGQCHEEFVYSSIYSGSSKGLLSNGEENNEKNDKSSVALPTSDSSKYRNAITKTGLNQLVKKTEVDKSRALKNNCIGVSPASTANAESNITRAQLKRNLSKPNFPIVVLNRDQITNKGLTVLNEEQPQFNGLDQHIWPFMKEWYEPILKSQRETSDLQTLCNKHKKDDAGVNMPPKNMVNKSGKMVIRNRNIKKFVNEPKNKKLHEIVANSTGIENQEQEKSKLQTPQSYDQIIKLLYKNSVAHSAISGSLQMSPYDGFSQNNTSNNLKENENNSTTCNKNLHHSVARPSKLQQYAKFYQGNRPWSKSQKTNDIIDSILENIKNGVYYTFEKSADKNCYGCDDNLNQTVALQLSTSADKSIQSISRVTVKKKCEPLPGFHQSLPELEIETLNANEISIKHCIANIMVRFDVTVPPESTPSIDHSTALIPLEVTNSHTKVFKCQTSLLNAVLPAELCSLIPKMIYSLAKSYDHNESNIAVKPIMGGNSDNELFTIPEVTRDGKFQLLTNKLPMSKAMAMSPEITRLLRGRYLFTSNVLTRTFILDKSKVFGKYDGLVVEELKPHFSRQHLLKWDFDPTVGLIKTDFDMDKNIAEEKQINTCTALIAYVAPESRIHTAVKPNNSLIMNTVPSFDKVPNVVHIFTFNSIHINLTITHLYADNLIRISLGSFLGEIPVTTNRNAMKNFNTRLKCISYVNSSRTERNINSVQSKSSVSYNITRAIRTTKKCDAYKNKKRKTTSLNKITNLRKFCHVLNVEKVPSVFDNCSRNKIMSCILEMKNWTTEINPNQAFLLLLLAFKKESPNLARYRHVLLQGISVNRITKIKELEMEIEVIEREELNKPAEASDYQLPFNESSERHLKSLLEKRKMLNPSYLRVMARYVGLGLLKPPKRNEIISIV